jgi:hypothetical protein
MTKIKSNKEFLKALVEILFNPDFRAVMAAETNSDGHPAESRCPSMPASKLCPVPACAKTLIALRLLLTSGEAASRRGVKIPFVDICAKHNFDGVEKAAFAFFIADAISSKHPYDLTRGGQTLINLLAGLFGRDNIERLCPIFYPPADYLSPGSFHALRICAMTRLGLRFN